MLPDKLLAVSKETPPLETPGNTPKQPKPMKHKSEDSLVTMATVGKATYQDQAPYHPRTG